MRAFDERTASERERESLARLHALQTGSAAGDPDFVTDAIREAVAPFPLKVQIQTSTRCNAGCTMCPYPDVTSEPSFHHQQMSPALYERILAELSDAPVERLSLFLMNEPLLDVRMPGWLAAARRALPNTTLSLFSNGSPLTASLARKLAEAGLDELCVSVHGFDRESYESVMRGLSFDRLQRNLAAVLDLEDEGKLGGLRLKIVTGDVPLLRDSLEKADPRTRERILLKGISNEREVAGLDDFLQGSTPRLDAANRPVLCQRPFVKLYVTADGSCVLCNVDWRRNEIMGRIGAPPDGQSIAEIWNGSRYRALRVQQIRGRFTPGSPCERCDYARVVDHE